MRGLLIGMAAMAAVVFALAGVELTAGEDAVAPSQWTVGGDDGLAMVDTDDHVVGTLEPSTGEPVIGSGDFDSLPTG